VYVSDSPGGASATIYRYDASLDDFATATVGAPAPVFLTGGTLPAAGTPEATVWCATPSASQIGCQRPWDIGSHPVVGGTSGFSFAFGLAVGPTSNLMITEDPTAGARSGRGTMWVAPFIP